MEIDLYECDPQKNDECSKSGCYLNGGPCHLTTQEKYKRTVKVMLDEFAIMPTRAHRTDAGLDLYSPVDKWVYANGMAQIDTGIHVEIPEGYVGLITSKSGLMSLGITTRGTIDSGYTGSIKAIIYNDGPCSYLVKKGQKITQLVIVPCITPEIEIVDKFRETERGDKGFGSTGS